MQVVYANISFIKEYFNKVLRFNKLNLTIGYFDGFHHKHLEILNKLSRDNEAKKTVITFDENYKVNHIIDPLNEKVLIFKEQKIDFLIIIKFDADLKSLSANEFESIISILQINELVIGQDFKYGNKKQGSVEKLAKVFPINMVKQDLEYSSTKLRSLIINGKLEEYNHLALNYNIKGFVVKGNQIGRTLGYPTANIKYDSKKLILKNGVYIVSSIINDKIIYGLCSIGLNETINRQDHIRVEVFFLNLNTNLYDLELKIEFIKKLREQVKFSSKAALIKQLDNDKASLIEFLKNYNGQQMKFN